MKPQQGRCLCEQAVYEVRRHPMWTTVCYCRFCQRATGSAGIIEPIFEVGDFRMVGGEVARYVHVSEGSGREVYINFCTTCGTKLFLRFDRWPDRLGVFMGTFDDPDWFDRSPENTKYVFLGEAQRGTLVPQGVRTFQEHAITRDGEPLEPEVTQEVLYLQGRSRIIAHEAGRAD
jgi:hypothetical protein